MDHLFEQLSCSCKYNIYLFMKKQH